MATSKLNKEFFINDEMLFVGYSSRMVAFCKNMHQAFTNNGIKVYPFNTKKSSNYDVKVYNSLEEMTVVPKTAFILFNEDSEIKVIKQLADKGVTRILFQDSKAGRKEVIEECSKMGIETLVACPLMKFGKGLHRFHGFCAGVR
jgi:acyl-CoA synthetase (NDP forming)